MQVTHIIILIRKAFNLITIRCVYDGGFEAFGNGKLEKQAKLVAAWNMIERLKKENIGIVNETLATGIVVDKNVLKKPVLQIFARLAWLNSLFPGCRAVH